MEHMLFSVNLVYGVQVRYYSGDTIRYEEDTQVLKPTFYCALPRIYEKIN